MTALLALLCFAANSLLCRFALGDGAIDPATFTTVRLSAGALALLLVVRPVGRHHLVPALALFAYAACFSFAYRSVTAATGALVLFGSVQLTMLTSARLSGERMSFRQTCGLAVGGAGLLYLLSPGLEAPPLGGAVLMMAAGIAWGAYSLVGRRADVAQHFLLALPLAAGLNGLFIADLEVSPRGAGLAILSGAVASGLGYAIWFRALETLKTTTASTIQLAVPVLAASGGALILAEPVTLRLVLGSLAVLGGMALGSARPDSSGNQSARAALRAPAAWVAPPGWRSPLAGDPPPSSRSGPR